MHHSTDRITHTTAFVTPVVDHWLEREIAQWVDSMKDRSDDPSHLAPKVLVCKIAVYIYIWVAGCLSGGCVCVGVCMCVVLCMWCVWGVGV